MQVKVPKSEENAPTVPEGDEEEHVPVSKYDPVHDACVAVPEPEQEYEQEPKQEPKQELEQEPQQESKQALEQEPEQESKQSLKQEPEQESEQEPKQEPKQEEKDLA